MNACKQCKKEIPLFSTLCDACKKEQEELEFKQKEKLAKEIHLQKEGEKQKLNEEIKTLIDVIVKATTKEKPLMYFFIHNDIETKESNNSIGTLVGGVLGGVTGAMMGSIFNSSTSKYTGNLGIVVVTKEHILIKYFNTNIFFPGCFHYFQLKQLLSTMSSHQTMREFKFEINNTQVSKNSIRSNNYTFSFGLSKIYKDETDVFEIPTNTDFVSLCKGLGSLVSVEGFIEELINKRNPITEQQYSIIVKEEDYFDKLAALIIKHDKRDLIIENFSCLSETIRNLVVTAINNYIKLSSLTIGCGSITALFFIFTLTYSLLALFGVVEQNSIPIFSGIACFFSLMLLVGFSIDFIKYIKNKKALKGIS